MQEKFTIAAMRRVLEAHSGEIRAELDRLKSIRTLDELRAWGREKGGALGALTKSHGPQLLAFVKSELARRTRGGRP